MATKSGRAADSLRSELVERPEHFDFYQAVRLLSRLFPESEEVGCAIDPSAESVRFRSTVSYRHPISDVEEIELLDAVNDPHADPAHAEMLVSFMGLGTAGAFGSLPLPYSQAVIDQVRGDRLPSGKTNRALGDFLDLFNHRLVSLLYRAWVKARLAPSFEATQRHEARGTASQVPSFFERAFLAVSGMQTGGLVEGLPLDARALFARAGLLAMAPAPPSAIEGILESYFEAPIHVEAFVPAWSSVEEGDQSRLGATGSRLGETLLLGSEVLLQQARFRVRLGPLPRAKYEALLPDQPGYRSLCALVRLACGCDLDFEVQLVLAQADVGPAILESDPDVPARLGYTAWLCEGPIGRDPDDALFEGGSQLDRLAA